MKRIRQRLPHYRLVLRSIDLTCRCCCHYWCFIQRQAKRWCMGQEEGKKNVKQVRFIRGQLVLAPREKTVAHVYYHCPRINGVGSQGGGRGGRISQFRNVCPPSPYLSILAIKIVLQLPFVIVDFPPCQSLRPDRGNGNEHVVFTRADLRASRRRIFIRHFQRLVVGNYLFRPPRSSVPKGLRNCSDRYVNHVNHHHYHCPFSGTCDPLVSQLPRACLLFVLFFFFFRISRLWPVLGLH